MSWVHYYLPSDLEFARREAHIKHGTVHTGIDPTAGGVGVDPDYCSMVAVERIGNKAFLRGFHMKKMPIEEQAQTFEAWMDLYQPSFCVVEDTTSKGYVYNALANQINDGKGTKYNFTIEKPQGRNAVGNKLVRFLSMAPRFENQQALVPAEQGVDGTIRIHRDWEPWADQWRSFPSGHDDALDATYWALFSTFKIPAAVSATKDASGVVSSANLSDAERAQLAEYQAKHPVLDNRGRVLQPIGTPMPRRPRIGIGNHRYNSYRQ
jgi:hypothetical protein